MPLFRYIKWNVQEEIEKVKPLVHQLLHECGPQATPQSKAIRLYQFVRDEIPFGFTPYFDIASPSQTLESKLGHCNPKAILLNTMYRAANIHSRMVFIPIVLNEIILNRFNDQGPKLQGIHAYTEVQLEEQAPWIAIDGYVLDASYYLKAKMRLQDAKRQVGYGIVEGSQIEWDGQTPCFSQNVGNLIHVDPTNNKKVVVERLEDLEAFMQSEDYPIMHKLFRYIPFNVISNQLCINNLNRDVWQTRNYGQ